MANEPLRIEDHLVDHGRIRVLRMNRPAVRNAIDTAMLIALVDALSDAGSDPAVLGVVLTGTDGAFSAGADVREAPADAGTRRMELFNAFYELLSTHPKPTVAAVEGPAIGGGAEAAAACDIRCAGRSAYFRFAGAIFGLPVGAARTIGLVGLGNAKDWVLSGRDIGAQEALRAGFLQRLVDDGQAEGAAYEWLALVASRDQPTVARLKHVLNVFSGLPDRVAWENDAVRTQDEIGRPPSGGALGMPTAAQQA